MSDLQIPFSSAEIDSFFSVWSCFCLLVGFSIQWVTFRRVRPGTIFSQYKTFPPPTLQAFIPRLFLESVTRPASPFPLFPSVESLLLKPLVVFWPKIQVAFQLYHTCSLSKYLSTTGGNKRVFSITSTATNRVKRRRSQSFTSSIWGPQHPQTSSSSWKPLDQRKWKIKHILTHYWL